MPTEITIQAYKFDELDERAKNKVRRWHNESLQLNEWYEFIIDEAKTKGYEHGFSIDDIRFSGFYSQGDGASWTGYVRLRRFMETHIPPGHKLYTRAQIYAELVADGWVAPSVDVSRRSYHYVHENTMEIGDIDDEALHSLSSNSDEVITSESILKGANVYELASSIDVADFAVELHELMQGKAREYAQEIFRELRNEYEYQTSDEVIAVNAEANEWLFTETGELI